MIASRSGRLYEPGQIITDDDAERMVQPEAAHAASEVDDGTTVVPEGGGIVLSAFIGAACLVAAAAFVSLCWPR